MKIEKINFILLISCIILLAYIAFYLPSAKNSRLKKCFDIAVSLERGRHSADDLTVTNQDISSFQKNVIACTAD